MNKNKEMQELEDLCKPVTEYLKKNWDSHCTVVISDSHIRLVRDEIGIPVRTAQEVPVQEQLNCAVVTKVGNTKAIHTSESINIQIDSETLSEVLKKLPKKSVAIHDKTCNKELLQPVENTDFIERIAKELAETLPRASNIIICESHDKNGWIKRRYYIDGNLIPNENVAYVKEGEPTITLADETVGSEKN